MPRSLALAAAIATALTVAGCGPAPLAGQAPGGAASQSAEPASGAERLESGDAHAESEQAAGSGEAGSGRAGSGQTSAEQAGATQAEAGQESAQADAAEGGGTGSGGAATELEASTFGGDAALRVNVGEPGLPVASGASIDDVLRLGAVATWIDAPRVLAISLPATDSCWPTAMAPVVESSTRLAIEFTGAEACGEPVGARTYTVQVPDGIDARAVLEVALDGLEHDFTLVLLPAR